MSLHCKCTTLETLICRARCHVTWCWDWVKSGLGCWGEWRCTVRLFTSAVGRIPARASAFLPLGKDPSEYVEGLQLKSLRSVRLQTLTNRHTCWEGIPPQDLFMWMYWNFILSHFSCSSCYGSIILMFAERHWWYYDCSAVAVSIMHWTWTCCC